MAKPVQKINSASTQKFVNIAEIKEDVVVMKDGTLRAILLVSSMNFSLKSEDEQNAVIAAYVNFLNALDFPLQIIIQSRQLNIDDYLARLVKVEKEQTNELLRLQTAEYRQFVGELVEIGQIMSKKFYIVVPYDPLSDKKKGFFSRVGNVFKPAYAITLAQERFLKRKRDLMQRVEHVVAGLNSVGLQSVMLDTQSLIELYYNTYNPGMGEKQKLSDVGKIKIENI
jgi:type IV secretory pathway VirB4 component